MATLRWGLFPFVQHRARPDAKAAIRPMDTQLADVHGVVTLIRLPPHPLQIQLDDPLRSGIKSPRGQWLPSFCGTPPRTAPCPVALPSYTGGAKAEMNSASVRP